MNTLLDGLYAITDSRLTPDQQLEEKVAAALQGGAKIIQYRDKSTDHKQRLKNACMLQKLCHHYDALFIVNDDVTLAKRSEADGVHLGLEDCPINHARDILGAGAIIGATCHGSLNNAHKAINAGADYLAFGRFFPSRTKPDAPLADLNYLAKKIPTLHKPCVAIGGVTLANARQLRDAGFSMLAVVEDIFAQNNIKGRSAAYTALLNSKPVDCLV